MSEYGKSYLEEVIGIISAIDTEQLEHIVDGLVKVREQKGRLFLLGVGGSASNAGHAACDFRKLCGIESYAATDNIAELTARINDDGWESCFSNWLEASNMNEKDAVMVFSVGGGDKSRQVSANIASAIDTAIESHSKVFGIIGRDGGYAAANADACIVIPPLFPDRVTAHTEGICAILWHLIANHPRLKLSPGKWESVDNGNGK